MLLLASLLAYLLQSGIFTLTCLYILNTALQYHMTSKQGNGKTKPIIKSLYMWLFDQELYKIHGIACPCIVLLHFGESEFFFGSVLKFLWLLL